MVDFETGETGGARFDITTNSNTQVGTYTFRVSAANTGNSTCASYLDYTVVIKPSRKPFAMEIGIGYQEIFQPTKTRWANITQPIIFIMAIIFFNSSVGK